MWDLTLTSPGIANGRYIMVPGALDWKPLLTAFGFEEDGKLFMRYG
jgi:hypothetical protein